jgi:hypothetical protein
MMKMNAKKMEMKKYLQINYDNFLYSRPVTPLAIILAVHPTINKIFS